MLSMHTLFLTTSLWKCVTKEFQNVVASRLLGDKGRPDFTQIIRCTTTGMFRTHVRQTTLALFKWARYSGNGPILRLYPTSKELLKYLLCT